MNASKTNIKKLINYGLAPLFIFAILFLYRIQILTYSNKPFKGILDIEKGEEFRDSKEMKRTGHELGSDEFQTWIIFASVQQIKAVMNRMIIPHANNAYFANRFWSYKKWEVRSLKKLLFAHRDNEMSFLVKEPISIPLIC